MFNRFLLILVVALLALVGCSSPVEQAPVSDAGRTWLDSQPAIVYAEPRNDVRPIPRFEVPDAADYHSPCSSYDSCGGSWLGFVCPADYTPRAEAHCTRDDGDTGQPLPVYCCYGAALP